MHRTKQGHRICSSTASIFLLASTAILAGCQEDLGTSPAALDDAPIIAEERLGTAVGSIRQTMNGDRTSQQQEPAPTTGVEDSPVAVVDSGETSTGENNETSSGHIAQETSQPPEQQPVQEEQSPVQEETAAVPDEPQEPSRDQERVAENEQEPPAEEEVAETTPEKNVAEEVVEEVAELPTLQWSAPLTREDGSSLYAGEIEGYQLYYRLRHEEEYKSIFVDSQQGTKLKLEQFLPGAYEFSITTIDSNGLESRRSEPVLVDVI